MLRIDYIMLYEYATLVIKYEYVINVIFHVDFIEITWITVSLDDFLYVTIFL